MKIIKICGDPHCQAIFHNIPVEIKKCKDCGGTIKMINQQTYKRKFENWFFQYDFETMEYHHKLK